MSWAPSVFCKKSMIRAGSTAVCPSAQESLTFASVKSAFSTCRELKNCLKSRMERKVANSSGKAPNLSRRERARASRSWPVAAPVRER